MEASYNVAVIGSGPGQKAAIQAAKLRKRVAMIDRPTALGGMCIHHGAIPSKALREAVLYFSGFYHRQAYGGQRRRDLTMQDLIARCAYVVDNEKSVIFTQPGITRLW